MGLSNYLNRKLHFSGAEVFIAEGGHGASSGGSVKRVSPMLHESALGG